MIVGDHTIEQTGGYGSCEIFHRVSADTHGPDFPLLNLLLQSGKSLINNLLHVTVFDVVHENHVEILKPHSFERNVNAFADPFRGKIEMLGGVPTELRADYQGIALIGRKDLPEYDFAHPAAIVGCGVDKSDSCIDRGSD